MLSQMKCWGCLADCVRSTWWAVVFGGHCVCVSNYWLFIFWCENTLKILTTESFMCSWICVKRAKRHSCEVVKQNNVGLWVVVAGTELWDLVHPCQVNPDGWWWGDPLQVGQTGRDWAGWSLTHMPYDLITWEWPCPEAPPLLLETH